MPYYFSRPRCNKFPAPHSAGQFLLFLLVTLLAFSSYPIPGKYLFSKVSGETDPRIRSIIQLSDGRIAFATVSGIDIFDGSRFSHLYNATGDSYTLAGYDGFHHLYVTHNGKYLWIKHKQTLQCINLDTEIYSTDIRATLNDCGISETVDNLFADSDGRLWIVSGQKLLQPESAISLSIDKGKGDLLDLGTDSNNLYLFYRSGTVCCIDLKSGKELYSVSAYRPDEQAKYAFTSHVVESRGKYYQIRNGGIGGFFRFDPVKREWTKILESNLWLNTLAVSDSNIFISTTDGLLSIDPETFDISHLRHLLTRSGNILASELSSIAVDKSGGIWIGTLNRGIYFYNPYLYNHYTISKERQDSDAVRLIASVFSEEPDGSIRLHRNGRNEKLIFPATSESEIKIEECDDSSARYAGEYGSGASFISSKGGIFFNEQDSYSIFLPKDSIINYTKRKPFLSGLLVNARVIEPLKEYDGDVILQNTLSNTSSISLSHNQNFITFQVTDPDYTIPSPKYFFMLEGIDQGWRESSQSDVTDRMLTTTYTALPPGEYTFRTRLGITDDYPESSVKIIIRHPWWSTPLAKMAYCILIILAIIFALGIYTKKAKKRIEAEQREANLLLRIKQLIEEVDRYKSEAPIADTDAESEAEQQPHTLSEDDRAFIAKAIELVEKNLDTPGYSVVQLSSDLCMDRTGLYRKLTALLDRSPSLFIRDIRLRKAASLLKEGKLTVTEIAEKTGFSTTSYMSKCFQERYGCKPSQYQHN